MSHSPFDERLVFLSCLCQLHKFPQVLAQIIRTKESWSALPSAESHELSPRQYRRWQLLADFWQKQGPSLLQQAQRRGKITIEFAQELYAFTLQLNPLAQKFMPAPPQYQALFLKQSSWGQLYGMPCEMSLRQLKYQNQFPPLHLSARLADASILSSAQLAMEAAQKWLGQKLALQEPPAIWAEIAFPDHVKLMDESASLAFVGRILQSVLATENPNMAFSGLVRRDTGKIETVQGFELPYGKLEAAFDSGLSHVILPKGTYLNALPEAGIILKQQSEQHYQYSLSGAADDVMDIFLVADLEEMFQICFAQADLNHVVTQFQSPNPQQSKLGLPSLKHWRELEAQLELPVQLKQPWQIMSQSMSIAYELSNAHLDDYQAWYEVHQHLQAFLKVLMAILNEGSEQVLHAESEAFERARRLLKHYGRSVLERTEQLPIDLIWGEIRFLMHSLHLPDLLIAEAFKQASPKSILAIQTERDNSHADADSLAQRLIDKQDIEAALQTYVDAGIQLHQQGYAEQALIWFDKAHALLSLFPAFRLNWSVLYHYLGDCALHSQNQEQAELWFQEALSLAKSSQSIQAMAQSYCDLAMVSLPQQAEDYLHQARELAETLKDSHLLAAIYRALGKWTSEQHSFQAGQPWFFKALGQSEPQSLAMAQTLEAMSYESIRAGQSQMAENDLLTCRQIYSQHQHQVGLSSVYHRLGAVCFYQQAYQRANYYFGEAQSYLQQTGNLKSLSHVNHNLGLLAEALKDYENGLHIFSENYQLALQLDDQRIAGLALNQRASIRLKLRDIAAASLDLFEAEAHLVKAKDARGLAYVKLNFGLLKLLEADPQNAENYLLSAQERFNTFQDIMAQDLLTLRLGHCLWLKGDFLAAQNAYERVLQSRQVLDSQQRDGLERAYLALGVNALCQQDLEQAETYLHQAVSILLQTREIPVLAFAFHNQMLLAKVQKKLELALQYKSERDMLIGIDRYQISKGIQFSEQPLMVLD